MAKLLYDYWFVQFDFPNEEGKPYKSSGGAMVWNENLKREIPQGWNDCKIKDFMRIFTGKKDVSKAVPGNYKFFSCAPEPIFKRVASIVLAVILSPEREPAAMRSALIVPEVIRVALISVA